MSKDLLDDLYYFMVEYDPCPYFHDPVYTKYRKQAQALENRVEEALGQSFLEALTAAEGDLSSFEMKQSFLTGLRLGVRLGLL